VRQPLKIAVSDLARTQIRTADEWWRLNRPKAPNAIREELDMTKPAQAVLADALRLDPDSRAELAAELLASLDGPADPDAEAAWSAEIERRVSAIEAGAVRLEPWAEIKRRIEREILGR
jgi:putative addiction module component (TIGR02574 family)